MTRRHVVRNMSMKPRGKRRARIAISRVIARFNEQWTARKRLQLEAERHGQVS